MTVDGEVKSLFASACKVSSLYNSLDSNGKFYAYNDSGILKAFNNEDEEPTVHTILDKATDLTVKDDITVVTSSSGESKMYNLKTGTEKLLHRSLLPMRACCLNHDGSLAILAGDEATLVLVGTSDQSVSQVKLSDEITSMSYNKSNDLVAISMSNGDVSIYSMNSSPPNLVTTIKKLTHSAMMDDDNAIEEDNLVATNCEWCPSNTDSFLVATPERNFKLFNRNDDFEKEESILQDQHEAKIVDFKFSNNGKYLASLDLKNYLCIWNFKTRKLLKKFEVEVEAEEQALNNLTWGPDNISLSLTTFGGSVIKYRRVVSEDEEEEDSAMPFGIDNEAGEASEDEVEKSKHRNEEENDDDGEESDIGIPSRSNFAFENEEDFIIDDDHAGYKEKRLFVDEDDDRDMESDHRSSKRYRGLTPTSSSSIPDIRYKLKPYSPGSTPWYSDRRYLTMNSIGYAWSVKQGSTHTITVSFFDRGLYKEYHFKDLFGYDLSSMTDVGILFATSGHGKKTSKATLMFRPHQNAGETWEKDVYLQKDEFLTSVTCSNSGIIVASSTGTLRFFNLFGVLMGLEKQSPIIACITNNKYFITITYNEKAQSFFYNVQDLDFKYYQRDVALPITIPNSILRDGKHHFVKGLFFSDDGDPVMVGHDNILLVLSRWRDPLQARWIPILDINDGIGQIGGVGDDLKCWPLGLYKSRLNCIVIRGSANGIYPSFPLPLPTEMDIKVPVSQRAEPGATADEEDPEEAFIRSKTMGELLNDTIASADVEDQFEAEERLVQLQMLYDKSLLKIFVSCCNEQNSLKAFNVAQEMKDDKALVASARIAERMGLIGLVRRINDMRENRMELEMKS